VDGIGCFNEKLNFGEKKPQAIGYWLMADFQSVNTSCAWVPLWFRVTNFPLEEAIQTQFACKS
jgi:hypothetical protein